MANTLQFVDSIASSPTLRLDLNQAPPSGKWYLKDANFSPPKLKKVRIATMLTDGSGIPASAYENRFIDLVLIATGTTKDDQATELQKFNREMDRQNNILKWQPVNATNPVFFRTFRSDYTWKLLPKSDETTLVYEIRAHIEAEPFAYGLRVTGSPVTVNNDPAAGSNPCYFDVTGVTGDVPTEAFIRIDPVPAGSYKTLIATRRHGTPGGVYILQAEAMTQVTDTAIQVNDAAMSGAGNNYSRTTFATTTAMANRLSSAAFPAAASVEIRGTYRIFVSVRPSAASPNINIRYLSSLGTAGPTVALTGAFRQWVDLGLINVPVTYADPVTEGYSNTVQAVEPVAFVLQAERTTGAATLDWDVVMAVPADEELSIVKAVNVDNVELVVDGPNDKVYQRTIATGNLYGAGTVSIEASGSFPFLAPNQTNRLAFILNTGTNSVSDDKTWTTSVTVSYWPRWLYIRP